MTDNVYDAMYMAEFRKASREQKLELLGATAYALYIEASVSKYDSIESYLADLDEIKRIASFDALLIQAEHASSDHDQLNAEFNNLLALLREAKNLKLELVRKQMQNDFKQHKQADYSSLLVQIQYATQALKDCAIALIGKLFVLFGGAD